MSDGVVRHLARLAAALRERGVAVGMSEQADGLAALALVDVLDRAEVGHALRAAFRIRPRDRVVFDAVLAADWNATPRPASSASSRNPPVVAPGSASTRLAALPAAPGGDGAEASTELGDRPGWSPEALLRRKAFDALAGAELEAMEKLVARLAERLATRPGRRRVPAARGQVDLRRSFRRAVSSGGELLRLARRGPARERPRLVVLCDTSGSMDPHTRFLLAFVLALRKVAGASEVFAFGTRLVRLTPWLRPGPLAATLERVAAGVPDWSGGTKIGECLADFAARHLETTVDARTVVIVFSDGLDRGDVAPLAAAMRAIHRRARRVLWLNPLAGDPRYEPSARAMAAALPFVDRLLPAHDLDSLARLLPLLAA